MEMIDDFDEYLKKYPNAKIPQKFQVGDFVIVNGRVDMSSYIILDGQKWYRFKKINIKNRIGKITANRYNGGGGTGINENYKVEFPFCEEICYAYSNTLSKISEEMYYDEYYDKKKIREKILDVDPYGEENWE